MVAMMLRLRLVLPVMVSFMLVSAVSACAIDGKPSAYANGVRAVIAKGAPTVAEYQTWWAHFIFPRTFRTGQHIAFHEDDALVRKALQAILPHPDRPWRWRFGDGAALMSDRPTHAYRRAGRYRVSVDAYFSAYGWKTFDTITITVRR